MTTSQMPVGSCQMGNLVHDGGDLLQYIELMIANVIKMPRCVSFFWRRYTLNVM